MCYQASDVKALALDKGTSRKVGHVERKVETCPYVVTNLRFNFLLSLPHPTMNSNFDIGLHLRMQRKPLMSSIRPVFLFFHFFVHSSPRPIVVSMPPGENTALYYAFCPTLFPPFSSPPRSPLSPPDYTTSGNGV